MKIGNFGSYGSFSSVELFQTERILVGVYSKRNRKQHRMVWSSYQGDL